jgi:hypothetical protein
MKISNCVTYRGVEMNVTGEYYPYFPGDFSEPPIAPYLDDMKIYVCGIEISDLLRENVLTEIEDIVCGKQK